MPAPSTKKNIARGRPFDADGALTRNRIINGARECFSQHGYANATNRMIAGQAGITASALYNYFPNKAELYCAVLEEGESHVAIAYEEAIKGIDSPLAAICAILDLNISMHGQFPELTYFFGHIRSEIGRHPELAAIMQDRDGPTEKIFRKLIRKAQQQGEISKAIPEKNIEMMLFACVLGMSAYGLQVESKQQLKNMQAFRMLIDGSLITKS
jgi:AcrR family transcriptional regulator